MLSGSAALSVAVAGPASGAPQPPAPVGDDVGFLAFGAVAESVLAAFYTASLALDGAGAPRAGAARPGAARERDNV